MKIVKLANSKQLIFCAELSSVKTYHVTFAEIPCTRINEIYALSSGMS